MNNNRDSIINIKDIGALEFLLALYPILGQYVYGWLHLDLLLSLVLSFMALTKKKGLLKCKPLLWFTVFVIVHEIVVFIMTGASNQTHLNYFISIVIFLSCIYIIVPAVDFKKFENSVNLVSVFCVIGLIYHFLLIQTGHSVTPIQLLPDFGETSRLHEIGERPVSFFWEPSSYISYMMVPLFLSLIRRKFIWSAVIMFTVLLSTSTNGIVFSFILIGGYVLTQKIGLKYKLIMVVFGIAFAFFLVNSSLFESGVEKINETDYEHTSRLYNGPTIVTNLPTKHLVFGIPRFNVYEYYSKTSYLGATQLIEKDDEIFLPTLYFITTKYGLVTLAVYIWLLVYIFKRSRKLWPYLLVVVIGMFSQIVVLNLGWAYTMIFMLCFANYDVKISNRFFQINVKKDEDININHAIC